ncbi:mucin-5AC-like isoform X2 [Odontomachus brunneus]|nr:mucin-5AC-like isoform X2 [Odontomachus brunneus]XP_032683108.1 mucin-5AC-like isoform X2 [Odontomachus brunneus]XP_032683109.1 mucin-5AC-like isoform X2 [Odontomachus brunneus]
MADIGKRALLREVNPQLICPLCRGYFVDATTVVECLHSFCRSCILKHLNEAPYCPSCKNALNMRKPHIKSDKTLQDIVYKLVPGLYHKEMRKRREFYKKHPEHADSATSEQRGEDVSGRLIFAPEDAVSLSLEYLSPGMDPLTILSTMDVDTSHLNSSNASCENTNNNTNNNNNNNHNNGNNRRYLQCPALVTIAHLKKFLALKYSVDMTRYTIEICHRRAPLPEHWTLMDVAYIYAWKRIAPMRFFYRVAQEEQRLEAPLHQRPSTPGLGACLPPNDAVVIVKDYSTDVFVDRSATPGSEAKQADDEASTAKEPSNVTNDKANSFTDKEKTTDNKVTVENRASESTTITTTTTTTTPTTTTPTTTTPTSTVVAKDRATKTTSLSKLTTTSATTMLTTTASIVTNTMTTTMTMATTTTTTTMTTMATTTTTTTTMTTTTTTTTTTSNDTNNKQIKSPIKIMKNPDGMYEVLKSPSMNRNGKEQSNVAADLPDVKPASPEFSVVSIGNGQNSNGVKITLKQCSPTSGTNVKKPKVISNILLRCGQQLEKDASSPLMTQQLQKDKEPPISPPEQDKQQEKQRRKVTFVDRPISEKTSPSSGATGMPKTALKKPAEQQDKKQFLQGFQLTAREPVPEDIKLKSPVRDLGTTSENNSSQKKDCATPKTEVSPKKDVKTREMIDEVKKKSNTENTGSNAANINVSTNMTVKCVGEMSSGNGARAHATISLNDAGTRASSSGTSNLANTNVNANTNVAHPAAKMDVYSFHSIDSSVLAGAVKRKCPPGVPINDLKRKRHHTQTPNEMPRKMVNLPADILPMKLPRGSSLDHMTPTSRSSSGIPDYHSNQNRPVSNANTKAPSGQTISSDPRNLLDGCGLNIPSSLSITLTSPRSPGSSLFPEISDNNDSRKTATLTKMNPTITLNDRSVDPRVLKALKTGQMKMPSPPKLTVIKQTDQNEALQQLQQRATLPMKRSRREQESILDLSGGKKADIHPLRIPQPVTKLQVNNKTINSLPDDQVVTLMGGHRYYRAPPGSLTPAAHRVNECPPLQTRTPVYAPNLSDISRTGPNLSSVFPSLQSLYVLSQSQFQLENRMRPPPSPCSAAESIASAVIGSGDGGVNPSCLSGIPSKTHLAAQCAPVKPARSSVASLAVPINKQQHSIEKPPSISIRSVPNNARKSIFQRNNEAPADDSYGPSRLTGQTRYSSSVENTNKFSPRSNIDGTKSNEQTNVENSKSSTAEVKNELTDNSKQQQQHHDTASPRVSSTASPSPPPGSNGANSRNESTTISHGNGNGNKASNAGAVSTAASATSSSLPKSNADTTSCKSPASPDSSSVTVESPTGKSCASSTDRTLPTDGRTTTDTTMKSSDSTVNPDDSGVADGTATSVDSKSSKVANPPIDAKQQALTTEMVQKRLLAVFPSNEWANNPEAAEHLGNFLKSLNATIKSDGHADESKTDKTERKPSVANDAAKISDDLVAKPKKDVVEHS